MGTWNVKPFGNDTAADWLCKLEKANDESVLTAALGSDAQADETIAAAAVIAAARRQPIGKLPPKAKSWVAERGFVSNDALLKQAMAAVEKLKTQSELRELWAESGSLTKWLKEMDSLLTSLREGQSLPSPVRSQKISSPRSLEKIAEKVNPNEESALREKLRNKLEAIIDLEAPVTGTHFPESPLTLLAKYGLLPEARRLVERGAKLNPVRKIGCLHSPLHSPLESACKYGQAEMAKWFLEQGAKITFNSLDGSVRSGTIATIEVLLKHIARLTTEEYNENKQLKVSCDMLLHKAVDAKHPEVIEFLVKNGLNLETRNNVGMTPLIWAALKVPCQDQKKIVAMLLDLGANANAKDNDGFTALDLASNQDVAELIKKHGGRLGKEISDSPGTEK